MGYVTAYTLSVFDNLLSVGDILKKSDPGLLYDFRGFDIEGYATDRVTWYEHEEDMREFSLLFPDVVFVLHGEGEDSDDLWNKYFLNGKMQYCGVQITYDPFDETKLE